MASEVMETLCIFVPIQYGYELHCTYLYFIFILIDIKDVPRRLLINITVDRVPRQRSFCEILRESRLIFL